VGFEVAEKNNARGANNPCLPISAFRAPFRKTTNHLSIIIIVDVNLNVIMFV
jgi:hypothetical protein